MAESKPIVVDNGDTPETWFREGCHITEWLNRADSPDASIARARVEPGATTRWHALRGVVERYLVLEGGGRVELGDGTQAMLRVGDAVVIPAGLAQRIHNPGDSGLVFLAICTPRFTPDCYCEIDPTDDSPGS
ncbi:MAG: cupin domain-containing protein [Burkholderiaceae bacterium]